MSDKATIIVIEDDQANRRSLVRALSREGYEVTAFSAAEPALQHLRENRQVNLVVTDLMLPGTDGFGVLEGARAVDPDVGVLMITGHGSVESAVEAMKRGADDYLTKPVNLEELRKRVSTLVQKAQLSRRVDELEKRLGEKFGQLIGGSKPMEALFRQMDLVSAARSNVLIVGESGTGKELVANALHEHSPRKDKRFLPINCAAIPSEILESELFGHERGAFTGATSRKIGKFELADGGTLFLDEIGELPLEMQVKLLRVLEQREFMRVGGAETISVDIRLIAATNQDLEVAVEQGRFRSDLYYRLKVVTLRIPPLRERREDIPRLAIHFLEKFAGENGRPGMRFAPDAMRALVAAPWEGNVRELKNLVESLVVLSPVDEIRLEDLPAEYGEPAADRDEEPAGAEQGGRPEPRDLTMEEIERRAILAALDKTKGNRTQAAEILGIGLRTLQRKLKEYRLAGLADGK
ncbi:MAG TPA: sigma-54 dependent transcriptional regulator [Candidatus Polarisedimenticolaceae bacterium]|nr:sigma-54 dependent transcriptional regulator [Candidatus Polarisedimenticolaceae bacterium]